MQLRPHALPPSVWSLVSITSKPKSIYLLSCSCVHTYFRKLFSFISYPASFYLSHQTKVNLSFILYLPSIDLSIRISYLYSATKEVKDHKKNVKNFEQKRYISAKAKSSCFANLKFHNLQVLANLLKVAPRRT